MIREIGGLCAAVLVVSCSGAPPGAGAGVASTSAFGRESGTVIDPSGVYDLQSARLRPLGVTTGDVEILYGHPDSVGKPFVMRIRELPGTIVPPHSHPVDEHITVVQGTWLFGFGETVDTTALQALSGGSYAFAPAGTTMFAYAPDLAVVQVHGVGPFHIHWREESRVLSEPGSEPSFRYRIGQRVDTPRGPGRIREGYRSGPVIQYEIVAESDVPFMVSEADVRLRSEQ